MHDEYYEQLKRTGHSSRLSDLELFSALGVKALRQPILWECSEDEPDAWKWTDAVVSKMSALRIRPIVGLVHHGSGPRNTHLLDPDFAPRLAEYAGQVARRYPDIHDYTPVNEPLTTARFSALYGHWYPHRRDEHSFAYALLTECRAVVLAMEAIRKINPKARLIQTDDLGKIYSTPKLAYQAEFENERRWCTFDLLCGRINRAHRMWRHFLWAGVRESDLQWFLDHPCPPDVIGINHYLSGERYLDEHVDRYPRDAEGGNGQECYSDILAARVLEHGTPGPSALFKEAWDRYRRPIAITECHNGCTREEQLRWFLEVWRSAESARAEGMDIVAVTAWSLLGAFDWNELVTKKNNHYEPGVYDIRSPEPRPTAIAHLITKLAANDDVSHPLLEVPGWWRRPERFIYGISVDELGCAHPAKRESLGQSYPEVRPVLITGAKGTLARAFARICEARGIPYRTLSRESLDIADPLSVRRALMLYGPWAVVNAAGYVRVDDAESESERCLRENVEGPAVLAEECVNRNVRLLTFSSDLVFGGDKCTPYVESDPLQPLNVYGRSKMEAEKLIAQLMPSALIVRSSAFFGPWDEYNFVVSALRALAARNILTAPQDAVVSPTYVPDLVNACLDLLIDGESGVWHLSNVGQISWADLAQQAAKRAGIPAHTLHRCRLEELRLPAKRPLFTAMSSERGVLLPSFEDALERFVMNFDMDLEKSYSDSDKLAA